VQRIFSTKHLCIPGSQSSMDSVLSKVAEDFKELADRAGQEIQRSVKEEIHRREEELDVREKMLNDREKYLDKREEELSQREKAFKFSTSEDGGPIFSRVCGTPTPARASGLQACAPSPGLIPASAPLPSPGKLPHGRTPTPPAWRANQSTDVHGHNSDPKCYHPVTPMSRWPRRSAESIHTPSARPPEMPGTPARSPDISLSARGTAAEGLSNPPSPRQSLAPSGSTSKLKEMFEQKVQSARQHTPTGTPNRGMRRASTPVDHGQPTMSKAMWCSPIPTPPKEKRSLAELLKEDEQRR